MFARWTLETAFSSADYVHLLLGTAATVNSNLSRVREDFKIKIF